MALATPVGTRYAYIAEIEALVVCISLDPEANDSCLKVASTIFKLLSPNSNSNTVIAPPILRTRWFLKRLCILDQDTRHRTSTPMADSGADHDALITQFCNLTGTAPHEVSFHLLE